MATSPTRKIPQEKNHVCDWPDCGKSFTRAEHLRRHALNHRQDDNSCDRCGVHFSRPDLLGRHMARHAKRDEEAGGPGLGVLETRKRTRRGPDGTIITRPTKKQAKAMARKAKALAEMGKEQLTSAAPSSSSSTGSAFGDGNFQSSTQAMTLSIPSANDFVGHDHDLSSISQSQSFGGSPTSGNLNPDAIKTCRPVDHSDHPLITHTVHGGPYDIYAEPIPGQFEVTHGLWHTQNNQLGFGHRSFSDFNTATSLNLPFAATYNYNWLFNVPSQYDAFSHVEMPLLAESASSREPSQWPRTLPHEGDAGSSHSGGRNALDRIFPLNTHLISFTTGATQYTLPPGHNSPFQDTIPNAPGSSPGFSLPSNSSADMPIEAQFPVLTGWIATAKFSQTTIRGYHDSGKLLGQAYPRLFLSCSH